MTTAQPVPGLEFELAPAPAQSWRVDHEAGTVTGVAAGHSDIFIDPGSGTTLSAESMLNAATFLGTPPEGDFEFSPDGDPMIVSVVARGVADDANAFTVTGRTAWLRVSRIDQAFAYHASTDGTTWRMIRFFAIDGAGPATRIGFEAQSPTGDGCTVTFDQIRFSRERLADLRDGS